MADLLQNITEESITRVLSSGHVYRGRNDDSFWFVYRNDLYPYKGVLALAGRDPHGRPPGSAVLNDSKVWRERISAMGFRIVYRNPAGNPEPANYWVAASYLGPSKKQVDHLEKFRRKDYWETDHNSGTAEGVRILTLMQNVRINDRIAVRYLDKMGNKVTIAAVGTVADISGAGNGKLKVIWDTGAPEIKAEKPHGTGAGNWWKTLLQLSRKEDVNLIFQTGTAGERVSRITWNENDWVLPSGEIGKSKASGLHEADYGYGGEEWLFDTSKIIDGYHYAFLEPINKQHQAFAGKVYDIHLYTIDSVSKSRYWIGLIKNTEVLTKLQASFAKERYQRNGWLQQMKQQIEDIGGDTTGFMTKKPLDIFNIRFRIADLIREGYPIEIPDGNAVLGYTRYAFTNFKPGMIEQEPIVPSHGFTFIATGDLTAEDLTDLPVKPRTAPPKPAENRYQHRKMSLKLTKLLKDTHGTNKVTREHPAGFGGKLIDIVRVDEDDRNIFYELKTYNDLMSSVREAIGQLLEYAVWTDQLRAKEWIIVTHLPLTDPVKTYLKHIRSTYTLPVNYQQYVHETNVLGELIAF